MDFSQWPREKLEEYLGFLFHNYRVVDAFWFINLENEHGLDYACQVNEKVWGKVASLAARDLKKRFGFEQGGLESFAQAQKLFPWSMLVGYEYIQKPGELIIEVPSCPTQEGRLKYGLGEYPCKAMHRAEFEGFAQEIDPAIRVQCLFAPPDEHPKDLYCRWRFTMAE